MTTIRLWIATTALVWACASAHAQSAASTQPLPPRVAVNIEAQPIRGALQAFGKQTGIQVLFRSENVTVEGLTTPRVIGELSAQEALDRLLANTGLKYEFVNEHTVRISSAHPPSGVKGTDDRVSPNAIPDRDPAEETQRTGSKATSEADDGSKTGIAEIIVTATKRSEALNRVPISIAALSPEALAESGVKSMRDVAALVPGIEFDSVTTWGPNLNNISIRGVNSTIGTSTTGIYLDDTPIQSRVQSFSYIGQPLPMTWDLERVEVDRGPQGTLFGAGAEGGAVRFIPSEPSLTQFSALAHTEVSQTKDGGVSYEMGVRWAARLSMVPWAGASVFGTGKMAATSIAWILSRVRTSIRTPTIPRARRRG